MVCSINDERQLADRPRFGVRVKLGFYPTESGVLSVPLGINYLILLRSETSFIEAGFGVTLAKEPAMFLDFSEDVYDKGFYDNIIPSVEYRRHTANNWMWRFKCNAGV